MSLDQFHPLVAQWFKSAFEAPTPVQEEAWAVIKKKQHALIAAPTGSGKTLAAFFSSIDELIKIDLKGQLQPQTQIVYVSPLKALSNDIEKNLRVPLQGIQELLKERQMGELGIRVAVRTGDTPASERAAMIKRPPHIVVTTPESLYLMLTSKNGRKILSTVNTVIVDEIHALVGNKRGAHLALSLERLESLVGNGLMRIGLSATQKPIEIVADFLMGKKERGKCKIIDTGHIRALDLGIVLPDSPLTPVMSNEVWGELYQKIEQLIQSHSTTLIFVNTRRLAERLSHHLTEQLGKNVVTAHHGSMSKEKRLDAEQRLKSGTLKALIATASLELGIDIGSVDLVCQIGSPKSIAAFLQRVGRSGHSVKGTPKGRLFPLSLDELVEAVALFDAIRRSELDAIIMPEEPLDVLSQQIIAEVSCGERSERALYELVKAAYPYRGLTRETFSQVLKMVAEGYTTRRGRRGAYLHRDMVNEQLRARKGANLTALVAGGTIPDQFDFDVILEPQGVFLGTINEDFAIESLPGDVFQLGNASWRILKVETGKVRVEDANGLPPSLPFWLGEAPGRSIEFSKSVSRLREEISERLGPSDELQIALEKDDPTWKNKSMEWLVNELKIDVEAADALVEYLATAKISLGVLPTQQRLVMERFFDEAGDMHLLIHSPFGSRLNRAWGLSLRKRFCRKFNFELQAAATEDAILLSLGATHSFSLPEVYHYLNAKTVRNVLVQALLDAPMFEVRWRWNASTALAILRRRAGKKVPPQIQRSQSEDLIALVFPDQLACLENVVGEREVPDHPLVQQTIGDCLHEVMDIDQLEVLLKRIESGELELIGKDVREASPLAQEILNARPYAFLDNAPLEERRTNAVRSRRWIDPKEASDLGKLDAHAIALVREEAWPQVTNADEMHDALLFMGYLTDEELSMAKCRGWEKWIDELVNVGRVVCLATADGECSLRLAIERLPQLLEIHPQATVKPSFQLSEKIQQAYMSEGMDPMVELIRGRLEVLGPVTAEQLAYSLNVDKSRVDQVLLALENDGFVFRGHFTPETSDQEWCERRLLSRIHRYTLDKLRKEIQPVNAAQFIQFLTEWQGLAGEEISVGPETLQRVIQQLEGFEAQAAAWESDILPARVKDYDYLWLDVLCLSGQTMWGKYGVSAAMKTQKLAGPIKTTPMAFVGRSNSKIWESTASEVAQEPYLSREAEKIKLALTKKGAVFFEELKESTGLFPSQVEEGINELVAKGEVTSDSFGGLRALLLSTKYKTRKRKVQRFGMDQAGRWSLIGQHVLTQEEKVQEEEAYIAFFAELLLKRYGVVFRKLADRERLAPPWRALVRVYRRMEDRGEVRGGRFVEGFWGEQFALSEAVPKLRAIKKAEKVSFVSICASDPLNLVGILTPGRKISSIFSNRILYRNGVPVAVKEGKEINYLIEATEQEKWEMQKKLLKRNSSPKLRAYLGKGVF